MESKVLDCAQAIFDIVESRDISQQPKSLTEISYILGRAIWLDYSVDDNDKRWLSEDLADLIRTMSQSELQSAHVLVYGNKSLSKDVIPF